MTVTASRNRAPGPEVAAFTGEFAALKPSLPGADLGWLADLREAALARFAATGLPTNKIEAWHYTTLRPLARIGFSSAAAGEATVQDAPRLLFGETAAHIVFVNGRFRPELSNLSELPPGVRLRTLADVLASEPHLLEHELPGLAELDEKPMLALNVAFMRDGFLLTVDDGKAVEAPIETVFVMVPDGQTPAVHPHSLILLGRNAAATVVERHVGLDGGAYLVNGAVEVALAEGARLRHYKVQDEGPDGHHLYHMRVRIGRGALYHSFLLSQGGKLARNQIDATLAGENAECLLDGAYMGRGRQHLDHTSLIEHAKPHARSRQVYHGVLDEQARGVFQGQIIVRPDAQKTDGHQLNRALLLSKGAEIDSKPMLEIYADDVKCSHGATTGDIDRDALFYLRARGVPEAEARALLVSAFLAEVFEHVPSETVRTALWRRVEGWLGRKSEGETR